MYTMCTIYRGFNILKRTASNIVKIRQNYIGYYNKYLPHQASAATLPCNVSSTAATKRLLVECWSVQNLQRRSPSTLSALHYSIFQVDQLEYRTGCPILPTDQIDNE